MWDGVEQWAGYSGWFDVTPRTPIVLLYTYMCGGYPTNYFTDTGHQNLCLNDIGEKISNEIYIAMIIKALTSLVEFWVLMDNIHAQPGTFA